MFNLEIITISIRVINLFMAPHSAVREPKQNKPHHVKWILFSFEHGPKNIWLPQTSSLFSSYYPYVSLTERASPHWSLLKLWFVKTNTQIQFNPITTKNPDEAVQEWRSLGLWEPNAGGRRSRRRHLGFRRRNHLHRLHLHADFALLRSSPRPSSRSCSSSRRLHQPQQRWR